MEPGSFQGVVGKTYHDSTPWWPEATRARAGAPNILVIVLDDVGFAQLGCFGSDIATPNLDRLATNGLRYTNFHTTALCSPTRACVLTGRNHHSNGMGRIIDLATGFPGYDAHIPKANGFLSEMLTPEGYAAWAVGKWHLTPEDECHVAATRARWPLGRGFERFYGFFEGETHQFAPALVADNQPIPTPRSIDDGYHLTEDLADQAIRLVQDLRAIDATKPFFCYLATGACHSPHQAPAEWIERYRGAFDAGWDAWRDATRARQLAYGVIPEGTQLSPRPEWVPPWDSLSEEERRVYARYMEAFAGFLSHADHHLGRVLDAFDEIGELDNTLTFVLSDNGASSEGGPTGSVNDARLWNVLPRTVAEALERINEIGGPRCHNNYPWGWTVAGNTPFKRWKREVHEGGVADPLIVHWPRGIAARGELRRQYVHAIDVTPTILEVVGVAPPDRINGIEQRPLEGVSVASTFSDKAAAEVHHTQYYEMFGCRAFYDRGWKAVTYHTIQADEPSFDEDEWELYHVAEDASECHDLAATYPAKLREMIDQWWRAAEQYQVLPLDNRPFSDLVLGRPSSVPPRDRYVYFPDGTPILEAVAVNVRNRSHTVTAHVTVPEDGAQGVLLAQGSLLGGWTLYINDAGVHYAHNLTGLEIHRIDAPCAISPGEHTVVFEFERTADHAGTGRLLVDGEVVGEGSIPRFTPTRFSLTGAGLTCGYDDGLTVVDVDGEPFVDPDDEAERAVITQ